MHCRSLARLAMRRAGSVAGCPGTALRQFSSQSQVGCLELAFLLAQGIEIGRIRQLLQLLRQRVQFLRQFFRRNAEFPSGGMFLEDLWIFLRLGSAFGLLLWKSRSLTSRNYFRDDAGKALILFGKGLGRAQPRRQCKADSLSSMQPSKSITIEHDTQCIEEPLARIDLLVLVVICSQSFYVHDDVRFPSMDPAGIIIISYGQLMASHLGLLQLPRSRSGSYRAAFRPQQQYVLA